MRSCVEWITNNSFSNDFIDLFDSDVAVYVYCILIRPSDARQLWSLGLAGEKIMQVY